MKDRKKVLLLGPAHPFRGGIADTQNYLAQNLESLGHEVTVFTFTSYCSPAKHSLVTKKLRVNSISKEKFTVLILLIGLKLRDPLT